MNCFETDSCQAMNVQTDGVVEMICSGLSSCRSSTINAMSDGAANIGTSMVSCTNHSACESMTLSTPSDLSLHCGDLLSCASATVQSISGTMRVACDVNQSCADMRVVLPSDFENGFFEITQTQNDVANGLYFSCNSDAVHTDFVWDTVLGKYQCAQMACCPWNPSKPPFALPNNTLTCNDSAEYPYSCVIDAANVTGQPQNPFFPKYDLSYV